MSEEKSEEKKKEPRSVYVDSLQFCFSCVVTLAFVMENLIWFQDLVLWKMLKIFPFLKILFLAK